MPPSAEVVDPSVARLLIKVRGELNAEIDNPKKWLVHGSVLFANGYYGESARALATAISIDREMPQATYIMATALWKLNKQEEAIIALEQALELIPDYDMGWRLLAEWRLDRGEVVQAETFARKAFELNSNRVGTRYILCQALMDSGQYSEAIKVIEQVTKLDKAPRWIYKLAGNCYRQLGENEKAEQALAKAGPPFKDWPDPMFKHIPKLIAGKSELTLYALHLFDTTGSQKAMPFLLRAFNINPEHLNLRVALSIAQQDAGQLGQSKKLLEDFQGEPSSTYWKQFASICIATDELDVAQEQIEKALALEPIDPNAHDIAAVIALEQNNPTKAVMHWEEAGKRYNEAERWAKAELSLAHALENGSTNTEILRALALAQLKTGHFLQAKITIQQLLKENPTDSVALDLEAMVPKE